MSGAHRSGRPLADRAELIWRNWKSTGSITGKRPRSAAADKTCIPQSIGGEERVCSRSRLSILERDVLEAIRSGAIPDAFR